MLKRVFPALAVIIFITGTCAHAGFFADDAVYFAFRPNEKKGGSVDRFGPVGIGIQLTTPAFGMKVKNVESGSPAAESGLKQGQIIDSINGETLKDIDPRIQLGNIITKAEAKDGLVRFMVKDKPDAPLREVVVKIPVLGAYSKTWPLNCKKSDQIVRDMADKLAEREELPLSHGAGPAMLFMLSTGEEKDLEVVRGWVKKMVEKFKTPKDVAPIQNWTVGYSGVPLCEYYLRTGDKSVLPLIKMIADHARWDMYNDGWAHGTYQGKRGPDARMAFPYMGGGHINACGVHVVTFLLMAKQCGVDVDSRTLERSFKHFFRYAARGNVPYGDGIPEQSFVDNGRTGGLAFTMAAAANMTPDGQDSVYAQARDNSAVKGFYSTSWMLIGHTGGGVGEIWRSYSMGLMNEKKPSKYREFMDNRRWFYELSRRHDGLFGIVGGGRYDRPESWGLTMGMTYTAPRKTLQITGAPRSKYHKQFKLPARPWGTAADDVFYSIEAARQNNGKQQDVDKEIFETDASQPVWTVMANPEVSDDILRKYAHHPDHGMRRGAASFVWQHKRDHLVPELLQSKDPRVRHAGTMAIHCTFKRRPMTTDRVTDEMAKLLGEMINDPEESYWVVENAMKSLAIARPEMIEPHVDRLLYWVGHEDWWMSAAAMIPLTKLAGDKRYAPKILPAVAKVMSKDTHVSRMSTAGRLFGSLRSAEKDVQALGVAVLAKAYNAFPEPEEIHPADKISMEGAADYLVGLIGGYAVGLQGGPDAIYAVSKKRYPEQVLPHGKLYLKQNPARLSPELQKALEAFKQQPAK